MNTILNYVILYIGLNMVCQSCKKGNSNNTVQQKKTEILNVNQAYQFDVGRFGDEEGASIQIQATHFSISMLERDVNTGQIVYNYIPALNLIGEDEVVIRAFRGSDGASPCNQITLTTIKLNVVNDAVR